MNSNQSTKQKIIEVARELFVKNGFAGTSMGQIAKLAAINHSLIFHHYKNKENLWSEVKHAIACDSNKMSKVLPDIELDFSEFLKQLFKNSINFYRDNPDIVRMIGWQRMEVASKSKIGVTLSDELQQWIRAFKHYQEIGVINKDIKVEFVISMILSIVSSAVTDNYVFLSDQRSLDNYLDFVHIIIINSIC